jgi:hypothetical protein
MTPIQNDTEGYNSATSHDYPFTALFLNSTILKGELAVVLRTPAVYFPSTKVEEFRPSLRETPPQKTPGSPPDVSW